MTDHLIQARTQESMHYGFPIVAARVSSLHELHESTRAFREGAATLLVLRVAMQDVAVIHEAESMGARLCDVLVSYALPGSRWKAADTLLPYAPAERGSTEPSVRLALQSDADALSEVAAQAFSIGVSHWHADPRTGGKPAKELYARWARDLGRSAAPDRPIVVAYHEDALVGFVAFEPIGPATWRVPLAAVIATARGKGLLRRLLCAGMQRLPEDDEGSLVYETQLTNVPAARVVQSLGFRLRASHATFHLWRSD